MRDWLPRLLVAVTLAGGLFALYLRASGAPPRVHVAEAVGLLAAFVVPALLVGEPRDLFRRWLPVSALIVVGTVLRTVLVAEVVGKFEFSLLPALALVPFVAVLLLVHSVVVGLLTRPRARAV